VVNPKVLIELNAMGNFPGICIERVAVCFWHTMYFYVFWLGCLKANKALCFV
jgi:hypothetical protein